jgi:hypothetical protein
MGDVRGGPRGWSPEGLSTATREGVALFDITPFAFDDWPDALRTSSGVRELH